MASVFARDTILAQLTANWAETPWFDVSDFVDADDIPKPDAQPFLLVQFLGGTDEQVTIGGHDEAGFREEGAFVLHYVAPSGLPAKPQLEAAERVRALFVGKRFPGLVIRNVTTFTDQDGATIGLNGPWKGYSAMALFYNDVKQNAAVT